VISQGVTPVANGTIALNTELVYMGDIQNSTNVNIAKDGIYLILMTANAANNTSKPYFALKINNVLNGEWQGTAGGNITSFRVLNLSAGDTVVIEASGYISNYGTYGLDAIVALKLS